MSERTMEAASTALRYVERAPPDALSHLVECFWSVRGTAGCRARVRAVLPDGCSDLLFELGGVTRVGGECRPDAYAVGTMTRAIRVEERGAVDVLGVRFRPGAAIPFLGVSARELVDDHAALRDLWGPDAATLHERIAEAPSPAARAALLAGALDERLRRTGTSPDRVVLRAAALLAGPASVAAHGAGAWSARAPDVADVAARLGVSRRHLERRFRDDVGLSPGELRRVGRLRRAAAMIAGEPEASLGSVALRAGYHDQAHMGRDFTALAGTTPGAYRDEIDPADRDAVRETS